MCHIIFNQFHNLNEIKDCEYRIPTTRYSRNSVLELTKSCYDITAWIAHMGSNQFSTICGLNRFRYVYVNKMVRINVIIIFIQYVARNRPWYSLRGLHIRITWFSLYGIRITLFSLYGIHMPLLPYMVIQPIVLGMALLWAAMDSSLSQWPLLWRHNDMAVIVSRDTRGRERDTRQRLDNVNARRLHR